MDRRQQRLVRVRELVSEAIAICDELGVTTAGNHMQLGLDHLDETGASIPLYDLPTDISGLN